MNAIRTLQGRTPIKVSPRVAIATCGDVFKGVVLSRLLKNCRNLPNACSFIDVYAGAGHYPMRHATGDGKITCAADVLWRSVRNKRLYTASDRNLAPYFKALHRFNPPMESGNVELNLTESLESQLSPQLYRFPGATQLAQYFLRPFDNIVSAEATENYDSLCELTKYDPRVLVSSLGASDVLKSYLPPRTGEGICWIDPPIEMQTNGNYIEYMARLVATTAYRWSTGTIAVTYPLCVMPSDLRTMGNPAGGRPLWLFKVLRRLGFKEIHCVEMHITENMLEVPKLNALGTKARPKPRSVFGDDDYLEGYGMAIVNLPPHMEEDLYGTLNALTTRLDRECRSDDTRRDWFEKILKQRLRYRMSKKWDEDDFDPVTLDPTGLSVEREEYQYGSAPELQVLARISQERDALRQQSHEEVDLPPHEAPIEEIDLDPLGRFVDDEPLTFTEQGLIHDGVELDGSVHELDLFRVIRATMPDRTVPEDNDVMLPGQSLVHNSRTAREEEELESDMLHRDILHQLAMEDIEGDIRKWEAETGLDYDRLSPELLADMLASKAKLPLDDDDSAAVAAAEAHGVSTFEFQQRMKQKVDASPKST